MKIATQFHGNPALRNAEGFGGIRAQPLPAVAAPRLETVAAALRAAGAIAGRAYANWGRAREARATGRMLSGLDDRTLRDLGFHRSEIGSVAAEVHGTALSTRVLRGRA